MKISVKAITKYGKGRTALVIRSGIVETRMDRENALEFLTELHARKAELAGEGWDLCRKALAQRLEVRKKFTLDLPDGCLSFP